MTRFLSSVASALGGIVLSGVLILAGIHSLPILLIPPIAFAAIGALVGERGLRHVLRLVSRM